MWKTVKEVLKCSPKSENMLKFCSKVKKVRKGAGNVKIVLQIRKSAEKLPSTTRTCLFTEWYVKLKARLIRRLWMGYLFAQYFD